MGIAKFSVAAAAGAVLSLAAGPAAAFAVGSASSDLFIFPGTVAGGVSIDASAEPGPGDTSESGSGLASTGTPTGVNSPAVEISAFVATQAGPGGGSALASQTNTATFVVTNSGTGPVTVEFPVA